MNSKIDLVRGQCPLDFPSEQSLASRANIDNPVLGLIAARLDHFHFDLQVRPARLQSPPTTLVCLRANSLPRVPITILVRRSVS